MAGNHAARGAHGNGRARAGATLSALAATLAATLSACGGDDTAASGPAPADTVTTAPAPAGQSGPRVLLVGIDGATYAQVQGAILRRELPNLAQLNVVPAATGGAPGTVTAQPTLDAPSWATVLTGTWVNRHGVDDDTGSTPLQAPTVFRHLRDAGKPGLQQGAVTSSTILPALLKAEQETGALDTLVDCVGVDNCVTQNALRQLQSGYGVVFAQYSAPAAAAETGGFGGGAYARALADTDKSVGELLAAVAARRQAQPGEDWLVLVTTSHGLDATGATTAAPTVENRTAFLATNKTLNAALARPGAAMPFTAAELSALPTEADLVPTMLAHAGVAANPAASRLDGAPLQTAAAGVRAIGASVGRYGDAITLSWQNPTESFGTMRVLRDGVVVASLAPGAREFTDSAFDMPTGLYRFNYTLVRNDVPVSYLAQIHYVKPVTLAATLRDGLATYFSMDSKPFVDSKGGATLGPWVAGTDGGSLADDNFTGKSLRVDSNVDAYKLVHNGADIALSPQFTIGFWFRTDCTQGNGTGAPVVANKNYFSGSNPGIAIGLFGSCELRFNLGSGGKRDDINGMKVSANQWAYLALSVDAAAKRFSAYVIDPVLGLQKTENKAIANTDVTKLAGLGTGWGVNDDATHNYVGNNPGALKGVMGFNDLAMWTRVLTLDELKTITGARQPLSSLNP
ncbi:alkaline phosphatase family protein [Cupriavidus sp. P-10]|uniref:LamG-like jellyroll fold domain-containing protein n=1 Tax=Cupriavidus sp. P-10 TaxID=2027911 RepID=UPI000E2FDA10|nr:LamG-like jellyroll fold domain-containing protein [Cupriavidus sp. P-10]BDB27079.1 alkaline phosphatase family protein [Cupriavidus sp. P-10]